MKRKEKRMLEIAEKPKSEGLLVSRENAASELGISARKLDYLIAENALPVRRIGRRVLISRQALERFANGR